MRIRNKDIIEEIMNTMSPTDVMEKVIEVTVEKTKQKCISEFKDIIITYVEYANQRQMLDEIKLRFERRRQ